MAENDERALAERLAAGLRQLADMVEHNPDLAEDMKQPLGSMSGYAFGAKPIATFIRAALRHGAKIVKQYPNDANPDLNFAAYANFGPVSIRLHTTREQVCERKRVGTETVTTTVKDPEALAAVPEVEVTEEVPVYEWECKPLLASTSDSAAVAG